eukprot:gene9597-17355_t
MDAFTETTPGVPIRYRCDGMLFNSRRLQNVTKVSETVIKDLLFADDCALNASKEQDMQQVMDNFSSTCDNFGLTISTKKTEVLYQPAPGNLYQEPNIRVKGQRLQAMEHFIFLGSTLSRSANIDAEVNNCIAKAVNAFGRPRKTVWERRELKHSGRKLGGQRKRYKDTLEVHLKDFNIDVDTWESLASNRPAWRSLIKGALHSQAKLLEAAKEKRKSRKARAENASNTLPTHWCQTCGRGFHARIVFISHSRNHR